MSRLLAKLLGLLALVPIAACTSTPEPPRRAVLITGGSTGIGRNITEHLAHDGFFVYAGARKPKDLEELNAIPNVQAISLDVTKPEEISAAVETITNAKRGLYGLINNAGVETVGSVVDTPWNEFDLVMAVNVYGPYRLTKAFAPLIQTARGRIINIGSIAGVIAGPNQSAYSMSKHAMEAFTDSLAEELGRSGVRVSIIDPGDYASEIWKTASARTGNPKLLATTPKGFPKPDDVALAAEKALSDQEPKRRYLVVPNQQEADAVIRRQIERLVQLNKDQPYTHDRDALIKMLDEALVKSAPPQK